MPEHPGKTHLLDALDDGSLRGIDQVVHYAAWNGADLDDLAAIDAAVAAMSQRRDAAIQSAVNCHGHTIRAVADALGRSKSDVGRIVRDGKGRPRKRTTT